MDFPEPVCPIIPENEPSSISRLTLFTAVFSNVELMKKIGLDVPQVTELMYLLKQSGFSADTHIIDEEKCVTALKALLEDRN